MFVNILHHNHRNALDGGGNDEKEEEHLEVEEELLETRAQVEELDLAVIGSEEETEVGGGSVKVKVLQHGEGKVCEEQLSWGLKLY